MTDTVVGAVGLGFVLGLQHATDPDHLVAVATIVTRERRFWDGALIGIIWGLGHWLTLTLAGAVVVILQLQIRPEVGRGLELVVAAVIVALGVLRLRDALRGFRSTPQEHLLADHHHDGREAFHSHPHRHGAHDHAHPHVHPSRALLRALAPGQRPAAIRALLVGAVHGLAGTAAVSLLVLATLRSPLDAVIYLVVFGLGTLAGMTALTTALAGPVVMAFRFRLAHRVLGLSAGVGAVVFGAIYAVRAI